MSDGVADRVPGSPQERADALLALFNGMYSCGEPVADLYADPGVKAAISAAIRAAVAEEREAIIGLVRSFGTGPSDDAPGTVKAIIEAIRARGQS